MAKKGRPVTKRGTAAAKKRAAEKKRYDSLPLAKRRAIVQKRDKEAQREADRKRQQNASPERKAYHKRANASTSAAHKTAPPKPKTCQWPGCQRTDHQLHHQGADRWLCPVHHAQAQRKRTNG